MQTTSGVMGARTGPLSREAPILLVVWRCTMQAEQKQSFEAYQRVQAFLADNPLPTPDSYGAPGELLRDVVARLTAHATDQSAGGRLRKAETKRQRILQGLLRARHLRPIARIASALLQDA